MGGNAAPYVVLSFGPQVILVSLSELALRLLAL